VKDKIRIQTKEVFIATKKNRQQKTKLLFVFHMKQEENRFCILYQAEKLTKE
jgi:hypothetical protein